MHIRLSILAGLVGLAGLAIVPALAQTARPPAAPAAPAPPAVPGFAAPPSAAPVDTAAADAKVTTTEVERKGRTGFDILIGTYLTLDRDCKVGPAPRLTTTTEPKGGKLRTRPGPINLRDVPGSPRRNCVGISPNGMAIVYRAERRFRGEERVVFRLTYPNGDIREVTAKISVQ